MGEWAANAPSISAAGASPDLDLSDLDNNAPSMAALIPSTATGNPPAIDAYGRAPGASQPWSSVNQSSSTNNP
ncbi:hypothetical protein N7512_007142 [Penicillium capsulatum]|nr:hypothetical protein N7512_007142 [Penicillium capsulatum]